MNDVMIPEGARLIHIGPKKTGTTALQNIFHGVRTELLRHGVCYPTAGRRDRLAAWSVTEGKSPRGLPDADIRHWEKFARRVDDESAGLRACIVDEKFCDASDDVAQRIVADLGGPLVHVAFVVRRLDVLLPSQWQQRIQSKQDISYDDWLRIVLGERPSSRAGMWDHFWRANDLAALAERWSRAASADRVRLVIADENDRQFLGRTFEEFLGLPAGLLQAQPVSSNRSLSWNEIELVRAINRAYAERSLPEDSWRGLIKQGVIEELKHSDRRAGDSSIVPPGWAVERIGELNEQRLAYVRSAAPRVVGSLDNLCTPDSFLHGDFAINLGALLTPDRAAAAVCATVRAALAYEDASADRGASK